MSQKTVETVVKAFGWLDGAFVKCSSVITFLLFVAWIVWPSQINLKARFAEGPAKGVIIDPVERRQFNDDFHVLTDPMTERVKRLGEKYTPAMHYEDIKAIKLWVSKRKTYDWELVNSTEGSAQAEIHR